MERQKKDWQLSHESFENMLRSLDPNREAAAYKYETIRSKLIKFFQWRGCGLSEEYADRTLDRVARRLLEGTKLSPNNPFLYFHGVALNLLREYWRDVRYQQQTTADAVEKYPSSDNEQTDQSDSKIFECLDRCFSSLPPESVEFLREYHGEGKNKERRKQLADRLSLPLNALRIRAFRLRLQLQQCVENCTGLATDKHRL